MRRFASVALMACLPVSIHAVQAQCPDCIEWLSVSALNIEADRVVAFDLKASDGFIRSFPNVPRGWFISITNDASRTAEVRANAQVGAASLDAGFFDRFAGIQRQSPATAVSRISLEIIVTKDFATERRIDVLPTNLVLSKSRRE